MYQLQWLRRVSSGYSAVPSDPVRAGPPVARDRCPVLAELPQSTMDLRANACVGNSVGNQERWKLIQKQVSNYIQRQLEHQIKTTYICLFRLVKRTESHDSLFSRLHLIVTDIYLCFPPPPLFLPPTSTHTHTRPKAPWNQTP